MTIDINDLRRKVNSTDIVDHIDLHANINPILSELIDRIEAAEKERDALRTKVDAMERQEPVAWVVPPSSHPHWGEHAMQDAAWEARQCGGTAKAEPLYAIPGAKGEEK